MKQQILRKVEQGIFYQVFYIKRNAEVVILFLFCYFFWVKYLLFPNQFSLDVYMHEFPQRLRQCLPVGCRVLSLSSCTFLLTLLLDILSVWPFYTLCLLRPNLWRLFISVVLQCKLRGIFMGMLLTIIILNDLNEILNRVNKAYKRSATFLRLTSW